MSNKPELKSKPTKEEKQERIIQLLEEILLKLQSIESELIFARSGRFE
jgi:hypothetical protein